MDEHRSGSTTRDAPRANEDATPAENHFFTGKYMAYYPALVRQVAARHEIGNHTWDHPRMTTLDRDGMRRQIDQAEREITRLTGVSPKPYFCPPYGAWNDTMLDTLGEAGYTHVFMWSIDTRDWSGNSAQEIRGRILKDAQPGAIVLMHGLGKHTVEGTQLAVPDLRALGYQFVTLSELLGKNRQSRDFGGDSYVVQNGDTWDSVSACDPVEPEGIGERSSTESGNFISITPFRFTFIIAGCWSQ